MLRIYISGPPDADDWYVGLDAAPGTVGKVIEVSEAEFGLLEAAHHAQYAYHQSLVTLYTRAAVINPRYCPSCRRSVGSAHLGRCVWAIRQRAEGVIGDAVVTEAQCERVG